MARQPAKPKKPLTPKQQLFVNEYLVDLNASQAALRAGYSPKTAPKQGFQLLENPRISHAIEQAKQKRINKIIITADEVLGGLQEVAARCLQKKPVMVFDRGERCMVQATDENGQGVWQFDSTGANRALELLGKHMALFTDKTENTGELTIRIEREGE